MFGRRQKPPVAAGAKAPQFQLSGLDGTAYSLDELLSIGPVLLAFYKISCPVCQLTAPYLQRLSAQTTIQVVGVSQDNATATTGFMHRFGLTFRTLLDLSEANYPASNAYGITSVPTLFLIESDGIVSRSIAGFSKRDFEDIAARAAIPIFTAEDHVPEWKAG